MLLEIKNSKLANVIEVVTNVEVNSKGLIAALVVSSALGLIGLALGWRIGFVALGLLIPWIPIFGLKLRTDMLAYGWLAFFELLVILQLAHLAEHVSQMVELHALAWPLPLARGIIGEFDIEPVHFWWNTTILFGATLLLFRYRRNGWLWSSWLFSIWHEIEHAYIYFHWYLGEGISGHPGILGAGGLVDQAHVAIPYLTTMGRADLHFWYNLFEIELFVIAFLVQAMRTIYPQILLRRVRWLTWRRALLGVGAAQVALMLLFAVVLHSPAH